MSLIGADLPTLYDYYTSGGINAGLSVSQPYFTLNDRNISLYSGAMHYFRVPKPYWRDRLRKMRAAGLNCVETYISWNLHEYENGTYDFGEGGSEYQDFLNITEFLKTAQEEDLLAIIRPGPFISAEIENGGIPSWLLREDKLKLRTAEETFLKYVTRWFNVLLPILALLQFTNGGPIVMFQIENEYANTGLKDKVYLEDLRQIMIHNNIVEILSTTDSYARGQDGTLPGVLFQTINFDGSNTDNAFRTLETMQPNKPLMVMEYWTGWFDYVGQTHQTKTASTFRTQFDAMLKYPANVNMYMFLGGSNFGFLNGASQANPPNYASFNPVTTSYDYNAPLSEAGDYTDKYEIVAEVIEKYNPIKTQLPERPTATKKVAYDTTKIQDYLDLVSVGELAQDVEISQRPVGLEFLSINNNSGQSYGYMIYRKENVNITAGSVLRIDGYVLDHVLVLVNGKLLNNKPLRNASDFDGFGYWKIQNSTITLPDAAENAVLELVVENMGRASSSSTAKKLKGIFLGGIFLNNREILDLKIIPLEFKKAWNQQLSSLEWKTSAVSAPGFFRAVLNIVDEPSDTFIDIRNWNKGFIIVNGFVLGRYAIIGPAQYVYLPAPFLQNGRNEIIFFEEFQAGTELRFIDEAIFI